MFRFSLKTNAALALFTLLGVITPYLQIEFLITLSHVFTTIFIKTLSVIALPILFLSLTSTLSSMSSLSEMKNISKKILAYTVLTTAMAASLALLIFFFVSPYLGFGVEPLSQVVEVKSYLDIVLDLFPSNFLAPFVEGNAFGVVFISFALGLGTQFLPKEKKDVLHMGFDALFSLFLQLAKSITVILPVASWAFMTELVSNLSHTNTSSLKMLIIFLVSIVSANLIQAFIILPALLLKNKINPRSLFKDVSKAISIAFFTKSSSAALPFSLDLVTNKSGISKKVSSFSLPLCSTINMNGCAQFILLSILFSSMYYGQAISFYGFLFWLAISIFAAIGNAGVPMGCYFLASLLLTSSSLPLGFMGLILPFYPFLDMIETAINVWSDICITAITDKQIKKAKPVAI
ncbi:MAG: C4-dicarboxylate transport protein [Chlamydiia bacterium]|nr:C4-dicarboxylate transport protein [Chlamydiia bacterium]